MLSKAEFRGGVLAVSAILIAALAVASVTPGLPGELLLQSLRFHLVVAGLVLAILAMLSGARWRGLLVLLAVLVGAGHGAASVWAYHERRVPVTEDAVATFRFLSFNVLTGNVRAGELVDAIIADPPDVMLVMETPGIEHYPDRLASVLPYRIGCSQSASCDISLHSRFPIADGRIDKVAPFRLERLVSGRITIDGHDITIAGLHLSKPYFDQASWVELRGINTILGKIEGPLVLGGDFNAAPWTEPVALLAKRQQLIPGPSMPATWPVRLGPFGVPIDNVFTRGNARVLRLEAGDNLGSNHRPLRAEVAIYPAP